MRLHTALSLDECRYRLASGTDVEKWAFSRSGYAGSRAILGKIYGETFRLRRRILYRNSFGTLFYGRFVKTDQGTLIEGRFRMHPVARVFSILALIFTLAMLVSVVARIVTAQAEFRKVKWLLLFLIGAPLCEFLILSSSWWISRGDERAIVNHLETVLQASEERQ